MIAENVSTIVIQDCCYQDKQKVFTFLSEFREKSFTFPKVSFDIFILRTCKIPGQELKYVFLIMKQESDSSTHNMVISVAIFIIIQPPAGRPNYQLDLLMRDSTDTYPSR